MERNTRPYLFHNDNTDSVNRFLRTSDSLQPGTSSSLITRFPTDGNDKFSSYSSHNTATSNSPFSSRFYGTDKRRSAGVRLPLYSSTVTTGNYGDQTSGGYRQPNDYNYGQRQQQARVIPTFQKDEAKKSKSALKSLRSFFKKHLGVGRRDYSSTSVNKRFSSALDINGSLPPYVTPIAHRRSTSSSLTGYARPQSYSLSRAAGRPIASSINATIPQKDNTSSSSTDSLAAINRKSVENFQKNFIGNRANGETSMNSIKSAIHGAAANHHSSINILPSTQKNATNNAKQRLSQPRPSTSDAISNLNSIKKETIESATIKVETPCLKGLSNHGNTCYFSAIMQCLTCCDQFAEHFICKGYNEQEKDSESLSKVLAATLCCLWFNNYSADSYCLKTLRTIGKANPQFVISHQQDAHECLIWLLDKLHEEIMKDKTESKLGDQKGIYPSLRTHKSEGELAVDALERISGGKNSTVMDLFRAQFRSAIECTNPLCGFANLTFDPYLSISLSVPLPKRTHQITALFVPFFRPRQIVRYHFDISVSLSTIRHLKERVIKTENGLPEEMVACHILSNGQCQFLSDDTQIDENFKEFTLMEVPKLNEQQKLQDLVVAVVVFVIGIVPDGERYGHPYVVVLNRQWSYDRISNFLLEKGSFLMPRAFHPLPSDYTLLIQHSPESVACLDPAMGKPLFHDCINKVLNTRDGEAMLKIIVEWSSSIKHEFIRIPSESIVNDYSFLRDRILNDASNYICQQIPISLVNLIEDYVKRESIQDWKCPKCGKSPGRKELKFHSLPNVLIFHLKRFELLDDGITKKIDSRVQIPLDGLDMSPYVYNPDMRASTLPMHRKDRSALDYLQEGSMLYDLVGVVYHFGERTNSGHYTATTRNPIDGQWRTFDDSRVSQPVDAGGEIRVSTKSYLLFYERRIHQGRSTANWFPKNVPNHVIEEYGKQSIIGDANEVSRTDGLMRGSSRFYTRMPFDDTTGRERAATATPVSERTIPVTPLDARSSFANPYNSLSRTSTIRSVNPYTTYLTNTSSQPYANTNSNSTTNRLDQYRYSTHKF